MKVKEFFEINKDVLELSKVRIVAHKKLSEEELKNMSYPYPYKKYKTKLELDDIGYSDKVLCFGCIVEKEQTI